jgi:predicted nuclease of restriction endonuclease-like (RecB) superfamily
MELIKKVILLFAIFPSVLLAQERIPIKGQLIYRNVNVIAANVVNNTAQLNTITDGEGAFELPVALGDEVIFSSVQYHIRTVTITPEILRKRRLIVTVNEKINALEEVVVTPENTEKFLDLKEEEFKGFDYERDKSSRLENTLVTQGQLKNGLNLINIAKLIAQAIGNKTQAEKEKLKPSEVLTYVFDDAFFIDDLQLKNDQIIGFLEHIDKNLPSQQLLKTGQQFQLIDYLIAESKKYRQSL